MEDLRLDIDKLAVKNARNHINEGRITRLEKVVIDLREDLLQDKRRSMRDNLIFSHIPESPKQNNAHTRNITMAFLQKELRIHPDDMKLIDIIRTHRIGQRGNYDRVTAAKINDKGKDVIWAHTKKLKGTDHSISVQLPRELEDRKT